MDPPLTQADVAAAIAEVEGLAPDKAGPPKPGAAANEPVVPVPVHGPDLKRPRPGASDRTADALAVPVDSGELAGRPVALNAAAQPAFDPDQAGPVAPEDDSEAGEPAARPNNLLWAVDAALNVLNWPFTRLNPEARRTIGLAGIITILLSLLAAFLLPRLVPRNDAIAFLQQKRAALTEKAAAPGGQPEHTSRSAPPRSGH